MSDRMSLVLPESQPAITDRFSNWVDRRAAVVFPAPALLVVFAIIIFPILYTLWMALQDWGLAYPTPPRFVGLDNYIKLLTDDERFRDAVVRTFYFTGLAVAVQTVLGVGMALIFHRQFLGRGVIRTLCVLPMMATPVAIALVFNMMYHPKLGVMNYFLSLLGLPPALWTFDSKSVIPSLALVDTWQWTPLIMLITLAGLAALPAEQYEAARIDGANRVQTFFYITLPLLRPTIMVAVLFRVIDALKQFDIIYVMTQGGPGNASETINLYLYQQGFSYFQMGYASSLVVVFFTLVVGVSFLFIRMRRAAW